MVLSCFFDSKTYYFIVDDILFYCNVYIILLRYLYYFITLIVKIDQLPQYICVNIIDKVTCGGAKSLALPLLLWNKSKVRIF